MKMQKLFDNTLDELASRIDANSEYNILMTAGLLRKLLVDGENSLLHQIDKKDQQVRFYINVREPLRKRIPKIFTERDLVTYSWLAGDGLNPDLANKSRDYNPQYLTLDNFLGYKVIYTKGEEITIRDLIKHIADKEGAIHRQRKSFSSDEVKNILLRELDDYLGIGNLPAGLNTLRIIASIIQRDLNIFKTSTS